jgi:hypothetical protein
MITADDIMPRHLRMTGEFPAQMTVPANATLADTRKQLVLRTFASTSGDALRTAKIVGITPDEVRSEIAALIRSNGGVAHGSEDSITAEKTKGVKVAAKPKAKKR